MDAQTIDAAARLLETVAIVTAVAVGAWFTFGAVACSAVRIAPHLRTAQIAARWSPAIVRRVAGVACSASVVLTPQLANAAHLARPAAVEMQTRAVVEDEPVVRAPATPPVAPPPTTTPPTEPAEPAAPPVVAPEAPPTARTHIVERGDNLWQLARAELGDNRSQAEIASYWRTLVEANRPTLRSGDPNLIFPGEAISLPPTG